MPGITIVQRDSAPPRTPPTDSGVWFVVAPLSTGPTAPTLITSHQALVDTFGARTAPSARTYDSIEAYFRRGGSKVYVRRVPTNAPDADVVDALADFDRELGTGQVSAPGNTSAAVVAALFAHGAAFGRTPIVDTPEAPTAAEAEAIASAVRGTVNDSEGGIFGPWVEVPGLASGTFRTVPASAFVAAAIATSDARTANPNVAAAGENGRLGPFAVGVTKSYTEVERAALSDAGVNVIRDVYDEPRIYGFRTVADRDDSPLHWQLANVRLDKAIAAEAEAIAERYLFRSLDGKGLTIAQFYGDLVAMLKGYYDLGALYGATQDDAFRVDVGPAVNTPETIANGELRAVLSIRRSPFAEFVTVEVVKVATTDAV